MGPALVWHRDSAAGQLLSFLGAATVMALGVAILAWLNDYFPQAFQAWQIWCIILVFAYLISNPLDIRTVSVGADWFQATGRRRWYQRHQKTNHIKLYQLVRIEGHYAAWTTRLYLEDAEGNAMNAFLFELQPSQRAWDLVHNGIVHSVANGATTNDSAERLLRLRDTPALRLRAAGGD